MIGRVLTLIKTLFDILLLRRGPEAIPGAPLVLVAVTSMWVLSGIALMLAYEGFTAKELSVGLFTGICAWLCYAGLLAFFGHSQRLLSTLSAITGCGALAVAGFTFIFAVLQPIVGPKQAYLAGYPLLLWSIPIEGYIVARAIGRPWIFGFMIALTVFFLQVFLDSLINPLTPANS